MNLIELMQSTAPFGLPLFLGFISGLGIGCGLLVGYWIAKDLDDGR